jgi:fatty acid desaturase
VKFYKDHHWTHHRYTGIYGKDLEFSSIHNYNLHAPLGKQVLKAHLKRLLLLKHLGHYITSTVYDPSDKIQWKLFRIIYVLLIFCTMLVSLYMPYYSILYALIIGVFLPLFIVWPSITYVMDILDHGGLIGKEFNLIPARNYTVNSRLLEALIFPRKDTYHLIHHIFPGLATDLLPQCHKELLATEPMYAKLAHTFVDLKLAYSKN